MIGCGLITAALCSSINTPLQEDDWSPPADWIPVPEPGANEMYFLIEVVDVSNDSDKQFRFMVARPKDGFAGFGQLTVDWGDGTVESWAGMQSENDYNNPENHGGSPSHMYTAVGQYLVKVTVSEQNRFYQSTHDLYSKGMHKLLIAKLGSNVIINNEDYTEDGTASYCSAFSSCRRLHYVSFYGKLPPSNGFGSCYALRKVDIKTPIATIPAYTFSACYSLSKFDFSNVEKIEDSAFSQSGITSVNAPKCVSIGNYAFNYDTVIRNISAPLCTAVGNNVFTSDYKLERAEFAEDCTFGTNNFTNCYSLYPRPDGSIN